MPSADFSTVSHLNREFESPRGETFANLRVNAKEG